MDCDSQNIFAYSPMSFQNSPRMDPFYTSQSSQPPRTLTPEILTTPPVLQAITLDSPENWCTVSYYELTNRIGPPFQTNRSSFFIDGFTCPNSEERFCLGNLPNAARDANIEQVRRSIAKGIKTTKSGPNVYIESLSNGSVFIQSASLSRELQRSPEFVYRLAPSATVRVFNNQSFAEVLNEAVGSDYKTVYSLNDFPTIRVSFVKGFGEEYRRPKVFCTPCWVEIRLNGPLQWLDRVLNELGHSIEPCSSMS